MIDLHSHVLPGVDDGAATLYGSIEIARAAVADGITAMAATPHVRADYPTSAATMERLVAEVNGALREERVPLVVLPGGELDLERMLDLSDDELRRFGLGGNPDYLLVETPYSGWPGTFRQVVLDLRLRGFTSVIAHPERNRQVQERPEQLRPLVDAGALVQLTAASIDGRLSRSCRDCAFRLLELGLAHMVASDAHAASVRAVGMSDAAAAIGDVRLARWLTVEVPGAIVHGESVPSRPRRRKPNASQALLRRLGRNRDH
jgi:protein-tyrosine phosphatase